MTKTPCTSKYSAVLLSSLLVVVAGLTSQSSSSLKDHVREWPSTAEPQADTRGHTRPNGGATPKPKGEISGAGDPASWRSYDPQLEPQLGEKFLHQLRLARDISAKHASSWIPCRNKTSGCRVILPAEEATNYSPLQHPSKFFLCLATVVCRDECTLKCTAPVEDSVPEKPLAPTQKENEQLVKFEEKVTSQVDALDVKLAKLIEEFDSQKNKLGEIGHQLNHFNDALQEKLRAATASTLQSVDSKAREVKALLNEKMGSMTTTLSSVLSTVAINPKTHRWILTGYAGHKAKAIERGWEWEKGEKVYLHHYLLSWGIEMKAEDGDVNLYLWIKLHKGRNDEFLDWPFSNELRLCLIHPETQQEHCASDKPSKAASKKKYFARPAMNSNSAVIFRRTKFESSYCEKNGFIKDDKMLVKLEVLS